MSAFVSAAGSPATQLSFGRSVTLCKFAQGDRYLVTPAEHLAYRLLAQCSVITHWRGLHSRQRQYDGPWRNRMD